MYINETLHIIDSVLFPIIALFSVLYFIAIITIIHEALHIFVLRYYNIPYYFDNKFMDYTIKILIPINKKWFTMSACMPYIFLMPIFIVMSYSTNLNIQLLGLIGIVHHMLNFPMEFMDGLTYGEYKRKTRKKSSILN